MRWLGGVELCVCVKRRLVGPELECDELIGGQGTLKDLELLTAGFLLHSAAAVRYSLGEFGTLPRLGVRGDDETDRHGSLLSCPRDCDGFVWLLALAPRACRLCLA